MATPLIVVAGNIASGTSVLCETLAEELGLRPALAPNDANPYLESFYKQPKRWAFHSQMFFLVEGIREHRQHDRDHHGWVQHRSVYEHFGVFAQQLREDKTLSVHDFTVLSDLYYSINDLLPKPDLLIYVDIPPTNIMKRLAKRKQPGDSDITLEYVERMGKRYQTFIDSWIRSPVLTVAPPLNAQDQENIAAEAAEMLERAFA